MKITSIETDISDDLTRDKTADTLNLTDPVAPTKPTKAPDLPEALVSSSVSAPKTVENTQEFGWVKKFTIAATLLWLFLIAGFLFSVLNIGANWQSYTPLQWIAIVGLVIGPALLIFLASYALKQLAAISKEAHFLAQTANAMSTPDDAVIGKSKVMASAIAAQVDDLNEKLNAAIGRLSSMEDVIKNQTQALDATNAGSRETIDKINASIENQNATLKSMTASLDASMVSLSKNLTMHTDNLAKSVQIAEQKIKEARISVEGATAKINTASDIVRSNTVQASATLSASHEDIKSLGDIIRQRSVELDEVYKKHAGELTAMIEHLRDEQTALGASMEERLVKMRDLSLSAQASAESLSNASKSGKETIEALAAAASLADGAVKTRFDEMRDMVEYSTEHAQSISDMAAKRVQDSLELTRKEIIRIEQEMADLQTRIAHKERKSLELVPSDIPDETQNLVKKTPKEKRKRTRLMLKPIINLEPEPEQGKTTPIQVEPIPEIKQATTKDTPPELAPLDLGDNLIEPDMIRQSVEPLPPHPLKPETLTPESIPAPAPVNAPVDIPDPAITPKDALKIPEQVVKSAVSASDEAVRRAAPIEEPKKSKPKNKGKFGLFGGLFGGQRSRDEPSALDIVNTAAPKPLNPNPPPTDDEILIADLAKLGLSANAVVDEGCIIEATNARVSSGHTAMSKCVGLRLKNPVEHLVKTLAVDDDLSDKAIIFASRYDRTIELLAGNREAIRTRLESEKGRAYLLCDAALNYGRV